MSEQNISPLRGLSFFAIDCYRHCAPTGLCFGTGTASESDSFSTSQLHRVP